MLLCVDFQPAYAEAFAHALGPLRSRLRLASRRREEVHFIYNEAYSLEGEELGDSIKRLISWGRKERLGLKNARIIRKNFGWISHLFREGNERKVGISILRHLMNRGLSNSAEIPPAELERIVATSHDEGSGFWDCSPSSWMEIQSGAIAMPFLFEGGVPEWIESLKGENIEVSGGFRHRCLDEICMLLEAGNIPFRLDETIVYSLPGQEADPASAPLWESDLVGNPRLVSSAGILAA